MLDLVLAVASVILLGVGSLTIVVGSLGVVRFPDVFARLHAAGMVDTLGAVSILVGLMLQTGFSLVTFKLFVLVGLFVFTTPVACHALARAALFAGERPLVVGDDDTASGGMLTLADGSRFSTGVADDTDERGV